MYKLILFVLICFCTESVLAESNIPRDRDGDGVRDKKDKCPDTPGLKEFNGCPDTDLDGVEDALDRCPKEPGLISLQGCPDSDHDGFADIEDLCPNLPGIENYNGCPDTDMDGVMDSKDDCPNLAGRIENKGCPIIDTDGDGVADEFDLCPNIKGSSEFNGCKELISDELDKIKVLAKRIRFETGQDQLNTENQKILQQLYSLMQQYPNYQWQINGYTDSLGSEEINLQLSNSRTEAIKKHLIILGLSPLSITSHGYGELHPIDNNHTLEGRLNNRRIEVESKLKTIN